MDHPIYQASLRPAATHTAHGHTHGLVDPSIVRSKAGVRAVGLSLAVLLVTSLVQLLLSGASHSVALLADIIHNAGDAMTAIPLSIAFILHDKQAERWAGYSVVVVIFLSAVVALYQVYDKFVHPQAIGNVWTLVLAGLIGVVGNEIAAVLRWRAGKKLHSSALIADGIHARTDGIVSFGVVIGAIFIAAGLPIADPVIGLIITVLILKSSLDSWQTIRHDTVNGLHQ